VVAEVEIVASGGHRSGQVPGKKKIDKKLRNPPIGQEIACHFKQDHAMVTKILDFIHKHPKYLLVKSCFYYLDRFSRNLAETDKTF
jgi:hypothetical protein